jgi:putative DNA primase/helicase
MTGDTLNAALQYLERGWSAIALCPYDHYAVGKEHAAYCRRSGKTPLMGQWKSQQKNLPTAREVARQFALAPAPNVGVVLGHVSALVGIDVDGKHAWDILTAHCGERIEPTSLFKTPHGYRLLYALPADREPPPNVTVSGENGQQIEVLSEGRLTVMPPSTAHRLPYEWLNDLQPAIAPEWIWTLRPKRPLCLHDGGTIFGPDPKTGRKGTRNDTMTRIAGAMRRHGCVEREITAALDAINERCVPALSPIEIAAIARSVVRYRPLAT